MKLKREVRSAWCRILFTSVLVASGAAQALGAGPASAKPISLSFATDEPSCPLAIVSTTSTAEYLFEQIKVRNVSNETIVGITFGVFIRPRDNADAKPFLFKARPVVTDIKPGQERVVEAFALPVDKAVEKSSSMKSAEVEAELGVVSVDFSAGSPWSFDGEKDGTFQ
jgi:hypothetical protein